MLFRSSFLHGALHLHYFGLRLLLYWHPKRRHRILQDRHHHNLARPGQRIQTEDDYCDNLTNVWTGREKVYEFIAPYTGQVTINMTGLSADLDLFVLESCDPTFCLDESLNLNTADETVMFDVVEGSHYIIVADGYDFAESTYTIQIICEGDLDCGGEEPIDCGDVILSSNTFTDGGFNSEIDYCQNGSFGWTGNERIIIFFSYCP